MQLRWAFNRLKSGIRIINKLVDSHLEWDDKYIAIRDIHEIIIMPAIDLLPLSFEWTTFSTSEETIVRAYIKALTEYAERVESMAESGCRTCNGGVPW